MLFRSIGYQPYISAAVCLLSFMIGGHWLYFTPTARISIDVNPSIELEINRFDKVVSVDAYNDDGRELADSLEIRFMGYKEAVNQILDDKGLGQQGHVRLPLAEEGGQLGVLCFVFHRTKGETILFSKLATSFTPVRSSPDRTREPVCVFKSVLNRYRASSCTNPAPPSTSGKYALQRCSSGVFSYQILCVQFGLLQTITSFWVA